MLRMDRSTAIFVDGPGRCGCHLRHPEPAPGPDIRAPLSSARPVALEDIAAELEQSKSNVSVNIRGLVEWHLVRRTRVALPQGPLRGGHRLLARDAGDHGAPLPVE